MKNYIKFVVILSIIFYLLPLVIKDTATGMLILLLVMPILIFNLTFWFVKKTKFSVWYPILVGLVFLPTVYLLYNSTAIIYVFIFSIISLIAAIIAGYKPVKKKTKLKNIK